MTAVDADELIDATYLPFTPTALRPHFLADADRHVAYFRESAERYHAFKASRPNLAGIPISQAQLPRQIEKDERFWTATSLKRLIEHRDGKRALIALLSKAFGEAPPIAGISTWEGCIFGDLSLVLEATLPSPSVYVQWLRDNLGSRHLVPYVLDAAKRASARTLEGATHVDAMIVNASNGFSLLVEAKVLSDLSYQVSFDMLRNQLARTIDVMLEPGSGLPHPLSARRPERSLCVLLSPAVFKARPSTRLYGWLFAEYRRDATALARDLPHRAQTDWEAVSQQLGWITFEDIRGQVPEACPWLNESAA